MLITVTYINQDINEYDAFDEISNNNLVCIMNCCNNKLTSFHVLITNINFPNLQVFSCYNNKLTLLLDNMNFPNLQEFNCSNNKLTSLPDNMICIFTYTFPIIIIPIIIFYFYTFSHFKRP